MDIKIKPLKWTLFIGNLLCICSNFSWFGNTKKFIMSVLVMILATVYSANAIKYAFLNVLVYFHIFGEIQSILYCGTSVYVILSSCYHSNSFQQAVFLLEANHLRFKDNAHYTNELRKVFLSIALHGVISFILTLETVFETYEDIIPHVDNSLIINVCTTIAIICSFTVNFEMYVPYCLLSVMAEQLDCITQSIEKFRASLKTSDSREDASESRQLEKLEQWKATYCAIAEISKLTNNIFNLQVTTMLATQISGYFMFLYFTVAEGLAGNMHVVTICSFFMYQLLYLWTVGLLSRAGQRLQNNAAVVRLRLTQLLLIDGACSKRTKSLLRVVSSSHIRMIAFGSFPVDMSLLPAFLMFATYNTVVALQFNNVI